MKKLEFTKVEAVDEMGNNRTFCYYLLVEEIKIPRFNIENYGISVEENTGDCVDIPNISTNYKRVEELLWILSEHKVSPTTCNDVISDWL